MFLWEPENAISYILFSLYFEKAFFIIHIDMLLELRKLY